MSEKSNKKLKKWRTVFFVAGVAVAGATVGLIMGYYFFYRTPIIPSLTKLHPVGANYTFINPVLAFGVGDKKQFTEYKPLENEINKLIADKETQGIASDASVYFRELESGRWTRINENDQFSPGSLLKVPIMIAFFKQAEEDPSFLTTEVKYQSTIDENAQENIKPSHSIVSGQTYTIDDLIKYMIVYSDNNAMYELYNHIDLKSLDEVYSDLGINYPENETNKDFLSAKQYSLFFRILYNATYLNDEMSEKALQLLSQVDFKNGLVAGLPDSTSVAHKFGERVYTLNGAAVTHELHDCGIVYYPNDPYVLCVMTKGVDLTEQEKIISQISGLVYSEVKNGFKAGN